MSYMLVDLNQVLISNLMQHLKQVSKSRDIDEPLVRHMSINTIRSIVKQFKNNYPNIILCCDGRNYWRKDVFPFYKSQRKVDRQASGYDWHLIFETLNKIRDELKNNFPYKVIEVDKAEADDIIATLSVRLAANSDVLIVSEDKDFSQLQKHPRISQYRPILKRFIKIDNPHTYLKEHIIRGDRGDGIPNFLSPDNTFVIGERQKMINSKKLQEWLEKDPSEFCTTDILVSNYNRNKTLVDFDYIPTEIQERIINEFDQLKPANKQKMLTYLIENGLTALIESASDF